MRKRSSPLHTIDQEKHEEQVEWADVEPIARELFDIWLIGSELRWAEYAWGLLGQAGLTSYQAEIERARCVFRVIALSAFYREFCVRAFDEGCSDEWRDQSFSELVGEYPKVSLFTLGQLAERAGIPADDSMEHDRSTLLNEVCEGLADWEYAEVVGTLGRQLDHAALFASLWQTPKCGVEYPLDDDEVSAIVNEDCTANKLMAYEWMVEELPEQ